jgi:hypothetical protein
MRLDQSMRAGVEAELDEYLVAKSVFRSRHTQSLEGTNKGLMAFDAVRRANSHLGRFDREETSGGGFSDRRFRRNNAFLFLALRDSGVLKNTEVRIAPPSVMPKHLTKAYSKTVLATDQLIRSLDGRTSASQAESPRIRLALHFKRAVTETETEARWNKKQRLAVTVSLLRKLLEFDRDTASFQDFRIRTYELHVPVAGLSNHREQAHALDRVSRVDLASPERGAGPWLIAPYIRLLKGDTSMLEHLASPLTRAYFPKWSLLHDQGRTRPPLGSPELRLTCHAGEDFHTLIDGLWHIEGAISGWRMGPGDALGHCLALGLDARRQLRDFERSRTPAGIELDSMVWLHLAAKRMGFSNLALLHKLEEWVLRAANAIYAEAGEAPAPQRIDLPTLTAKIEMAAEPLLVPRGFMPSKLPVRLDGLPHYISSAARLRLLDFFHPAVAQRRDRRKKPSSLHHELPDLITEVQKGLIDLICSKGITVETNPSSNMRMERIENPAELPVWSMIDPERGSPHITICTDNPGTYDINIATEYALMFSALLKTLGPHHRKECIARLNTMREAGFRLFDGFD